MIKSNTIIRRSQKFIFALVASGVVILFLGFGIFYAVASIPQDCSSSVCSSLYPLLPTLTPNSSTSSTTLENAFTNFLSEDTPAHVPDVLGKKSVFETMTVANDVVFNGSEIDAPELNIDNSATFWNTATGGNGLEIVPSQNISAVGLTGTASDGSGIKASGTTAGISADSTSNTGLSATSSIGVGAYVSGDLIGLYSFGATIGLTANAPVVGKTTGTDEESRVGVSGGISDAQGALGAYQSAYQNGYYGIYTEDNAQSASLSVAEGSWLSGKLIGRNLSDGETSDSKAGFSNKPTIGLIASSLTFLNSLEIDGDVTIGGDLTSWLSYASGGFTIGGVISSSEKDTVNFYPGATVEGDTTAANSVTADQGIGKFYTVISNIAYGHTTVYCENRSNQGLVSCGGSVYNANEYAGARRISISSTSADGLTIDKLGCQAYAQSSDKAVHAIAYCFDPLGIAQSSGEMPDVTQAPEIPQCVDSDFDGICNTTDNCQNQSNPNQEDSDGDDIGNVCDNCKTTSNADQNDSDSDGIGTACDNCSSISNAGQEDYDSDGDGDACDNCKNASNANQLNSDTDSLGDECDNCDNIANSDQIDSDTDGIGNACEAGACTPASTQSCGSDVGACSPGTQTCQSDYTWGSCTGAVSSTTEICDDKDNDCDTETDEGDVCPCPSPSVPTITETYPSATQVKFNFTSNNATQYCAYQPALAQWTCSAINTPLTINVNDASWVDHSWADSARSKNFYLYYYLKNDCDTGSTSYYPSTPGGYTFSYESYTVWKFMTDADQDSYRPTDIFSYQSTNSASSGSTLYTNPDKTDCNDANAAINPGATEICDDGIDNDCDGQSLTNCTSTPTCPDFTSPPTVTKDNTNQRFSISWDDIWGSNPYSYNYEIYYNEIKKAYDSTTSTSLTLPYSGGYSDSKPYTFRVRTFEEMDFDCYGNWSSVDFQHCPPPNTPSPQVAISGDTISVSWSAVPGADSYCYLIKQGDTFIKNEICNSGSTSQTYNTSEFTAGTTYTFFVRAKNTFCATNQASSFGSDDFVLQATTCATPGTPAVSISYLDSYTDIKFTLDGTNTTEYCFWAPGLDDWQCQPATAADTSLQFDVANATWGHTWTDSRQSDNFYLFYKLKNECGTGTTSTAPTASPYYYGTEYFIYKYMLDKDGDNYRPYDSFSYRGKTQSGGYDDYNTLYTNPDKTDCDDTKSSVNPGATETTGDGIDQNCDGKETCYKDSDKDAYSISTTASSSDFSCSKSNGLKSTLSSPADCDDTKSSVNPGATETYGDEVDQNCDGKEMCYRDYDNDNYRTTSSTSYTYESTSDTDCLDSHELKSSDLTGDCADSDDSINPGATDLCGDGIDQDCSGSDTTCRENPPCSTGLCKADTKIDFNNTYADIFWHWWFLDVGEICTGATCTPDIRATDCGVYCPDELSDNSDILSDSQSPLSGWNGLNENGNYIGDMSATAVAYLIQMNWLTSAQINALDNTLYEAADALLGTHSFDSSGALTDTSWAQADSTAYDNYVDGLNSSKSSAHQNMQTQTEMN